MRLLTSRSGVRASQGASFDCSYQHHLVLLCLRRKASEKLGWKACCLAQVAERKALNLVVVGSSPTTDVLQWPHGQLPHGAADANSNSNEWTHWDSKPLHHAPHMDARATHASRMQAHFVLPFGARVGFTILRKRAKQERVCNTFARGPIAQLGECQTEDLKVPGSIPGRLELPTLRLTASRSNQLS